MLRICEETFDPGQELSAFNSRNDRAGAVVSFLGQVRAQSGTDDVTGLVLEHYPGVTETGIAEINAEAIMRWTLIDTLIIHRVGQLAAGAPIVLVATAADHRRQAFEAVDYLMDYLKTRALFWKKELSGDRSVWIEPRDEDYQDAARWVKQSDER